MAALIRQLIFWRGCLYVERSLSKGLCTGLVKEKEWKFPELARGEGSTKTHHVGHWRVSAGQTFQIIVLVNGFTGRDISVPWLIIFVEGHLYICKNEHQFFKVHTKSQLFNQGRTLTPVPLSTKKLKARPYISCHIGVNYMQRNNFLSSSWMQ